MGWKMASPTDGTDLETSLLSFEKLDRASPDLWPEQLPGVAEFAASFKSPITSSPPKWMAEIERDDIDMLKELGSLTTANLMEKVRGLQNLAYQLGLDEFELYTREEQSRVWWHPLQFHQPTGGRGRQDDQQFDILGNTEKLEISSAYMNPI
ncbi:protein lin-52 homolog isoform X1 [Chionomys nivalis]|uniref:protein lin-52 homolog isoform X1 n=1 Tax=Chionomys nivalis TaxID=269649 RepID=UPI0025976E96|nr:protein lin-52 homolog isoform X1 [Chionomys nivalis]XP_057638690.1 protein lin-52 homolog isoform X1 [Chionomys nivalis]